MVNMKKTLLYILFFSFSQLLISQNNHPKFKDLLSTSPDLVVPFCLKNSPKMVKFLNNEGVRIKYFTDKWLFVSTTPLWINTNQNLGNIDQFYFEFAPGSILNDTTRLQRYVDPVHNGTGGLTQPYTGNNVVLGFIDDGFDINHPDFKDANGKTRVLRLWDQTVSSTGNIYSEYNYGRLWDSTKINAGLCNHVPKLHGTLVTGSGAGNGLSNGKNKGMAPESKIVLVSSNGSSPNWSLTIADACDYIFKFADSLGLPAAINISLGAYWGSHDANDPGAKAMEQLLDEKPGRIIVAALGNAGAWLPFHVSGNVTTDTTFVWFNNDATGTNANSVQFDLWADTSDSHFDFAFGADKPPPTYGFRGRSNYINTYSTLNAIIYDTIWNGSNRIATIQLWAEVVDSAYHLQLFMDKLDSTSYKIRFMTKGTGKYDLWSGVNVGANSMITTIPSALILPQIVNYQMPDNLQTLVSGFQCSEKIITVGNIRGRNQYINKNNVMSSMAANPPGKISPNSSTGPTRLGIQKPDISFNGDGVLSTSRLAFLANASNNGQIAQAGWHSIGGGTSQASPGVAGVAALYLEKCPKSSYNDFKKDLISTASKNSYTGVVPNYSYGYGQPHVLNLMLGANNVSILGGTGICSTPISLSTNNTYSIVDSIVWSSGQNAITLSTSIPSKYSASVYYGNGCIAHSDTILLTQKLVIPSPMISDNNGVISSDYQSNYSWMLNGVIIPNQSSQFLFITPPYGSYNTSVVSVDGCVSYSNTININLGLIENDQNLGSVSPNPTLSDFIINTSFDLISVTATDINGKDVELVRKGEKKYSISHLKIGVYYLKLETSNGLFRSKIMKM